jgi:uncharacterized membrane protein YfcA
VTVDPSVLLLLLLVAVVAGFVDSIAGGGGLLTVPALLAAGLGPGAALGTNKLQSVAGSSTAAVTYARGGAVQPRTLVPAVITTFVGSALGTYVVTSIDPSALEQLLPWLLLGIAAYIACKPDLGHVETASRISARAYTAGVAPIIGAYDGFLGPGTGSFFALTLVGLRGHELTRATATAKVLNLTSNAAALLVFIARGVPVWQVGAVMAVGQALGARAGARTVLLRGSRLVRPALIVASVALSLSLLFR